MTIGYVTVEEALWLAGMALFVSLCSTASHVGPRYSIDRFPKLGRDALGFFGFLAIFLFLFMVLMCASVKRIEPL